MSDFRYLSWASIFLATAFGSFGSAAFADVTISIAQTQNMSCSGGVCVPTATDAVLNTGDLDAMLAAGNASVLTTGSGVQANNIVVASKLALKTANNLTFDAYESVMVDALVSATTKTSLTLRTSDGGTGGALSFTPKGRIEFDVLSSVLSINGISFTLVNSISSLAKAIAANSSGNFALATDYDASGDATYHGSPIPTEVSGTVQGLGNAISNLSVHFGNARKLVSGVFDNTNTTGSIQNLRLVNERAQVSNGAEWGGLVGRNYGILFGDSVTGTFKAKGTGTAAAGVASGNYNQLQYSSANVQISASAGYGAGLAGGNIGQIVGCHADGTVKALSAGGLVGFNEGYIDQSYATSKINGGTSAMAGGLIAEEEGETTNSYATGSVSGGDGSMVGGLVGETTHQTYTSYSTGAVSGGASSEVGGFVGDDSAAIISDSYWDTTTSGTDEGTGEGNVSGLTGLTSQQLQSGLPAGFDPTIWAQDASINNGFPYLINNPPVK